jgi:hypothetical protein
MTVALSAQFARSLETVLQGIRQDAGYLTDLGLSVHRGFFAHVIKGRDGIFPAVIIHPGPEVVSSVHGSGGKAIVSIQAPLVIAVEASLGPDAYEQVQACTFDVRRALMRARDDIAQLGQRDSFEIDSTEHEISRDSRFVLAAMAVGISIVETYQP